MFGLQYVFAVNNFSSWWANWSAADNFVLVVAGKFISNEQIKAGPIYKYFVELGCFARTSGGIASARDCFWSNMFDDNILWFPEIWMKGSILPQALSIVIPIYGAILFVKFPHSKINLHILLASLWSFHIQRSTDIFWSPAYWVQHFLFICCCIFLNTWSTIVLINKI